VERGERVCRGAVSGGELANVPQGEQRRGLEPHHETQPPGVMATGEPPPPLMSAATVRVHWIEHCSLQSMGNEKSLDEGP
jgi:hypothetical protein